MRRGGRFREGHKLNYKNTGGGGGAAREGRAAREDVSARKSPGDLSRRLAGFGRRRRALVGTLARAPVAWVQPVVQGGVAPGDDELGNTRIQRGRASPPTEQVLHHTGSRGGAVPETNWNDTKRRC